MIPYGQQNISEDDIQAVVDVLRSDFLTQGPCVPSFEDALATYCRAAFGVAVNSATSALHLACLALDVGVGDIVWTTPITFVASANCGRYCGADVSFVDIDPSTYNMSVAKLEEKLENAFATDTLPKVVIPVHLSGQSCEMDKIHALSQRYGFKIIEDASHAIGGRYKSQPIGSCVYSDITVFSFHPVKIITTAEGGVAVTNNADIADRLRLLRSHGITRDHDKMTGLSHGPWYYQQLELGYNYRMTELQAALGMSQMSRLDDFVTKRHEIAHRYYILLENFPIIMPFQHADSFSAFHLFIIRLNLDYIEKTHLQVFEELREQGIGINIHYIPVHLQPFYCALGFTEGDYPESEKYYSEALSIPLYPGLTVEMQSKVVAVLKTVLCV